ncbi:hypothetical protein BDP27DRAFT_1242482, partial [Rhodocollybia butyracea]
MRPAFNLDNEHPEAHTHVLKLERPSSRKVPVLIGPAVPRQDRPAVWTRYCRLMLILFKPWKNLADLLMPHSTWSSAFEQFQASCDERILGYMRNMQILHECRDSRDNH